MVTKTISKTTQKFNTKEKFLECLIDDVACCVNGLSNIAKKVLFTIMQNLNDNNILQYNKDLISFFKSKTNLSQASIYNALKELQQKKIITKLKLDSEHKYSYHADPFFIGNNPYNSNKQFRRKIFQDFNVITQEIFIYKGGLQEIDETTNEASSFIDKFAGSLSGSFHPTKTAKEMKQESLLKDMQQGKI